MKIIVQAGGMGTRLGSLTANKPKCLVPVHNLPMVFHLFKKYPKDEFIIIGDYKFEVLKKYLEVFARDIKYKLIKADGRGNICGIKKALNYVPNNEKIMLIWSDLILSDKFKPEGLTDGNYIGILENQLCSWSFKNGQLDKISTDKYGVAGCFIFKDKSYLENIAQEGSFTGWLKTSGIELFPMQMPDCFEIGTLESVENLKDNTNRCRPYNKIDFSDNYIIKTGITEEGKSLIEKELDWYKKISDYGFKYIPEIFSFTPLTIKKINGTNLFQAKLTEKQKDNITEKLIHALDKLHNYEKAPANSADIIKEYYTKTIDRVLSIKPVIPFAENKYIKVNGILCKNPIKFKNEFKKYIENNLLDTEFCPIHGDCTLTNILLDNNKKDFYFIDPRGYFGTNSVIGDIRYDWAKLYYSMKGNFDRFNIKDFCLKISEAGITYSIQSNGWEAYAAKILAHLKKDKQDHIRFIHAIIWLSLASHCWEDYDSMCLAFYVGTFLINEFL